jgi:UPF0755 protein
MITAEMGNYELLKKLRSGRQDAIRLTFNNIRLKKIWCIKLVIVSNLIH